jgi:DNA-binding helix-hairpin-helix protein with protein kinase domain
MLQTPEERLHTLCEKYPEAAERFKEQLETLYDENREFVGFKMPLIQDTIPLLEVFNPRLRAKKLPGFNRL